ncbi:uncharacterized protein TRIVIDRAFT_66654 [Trichoderma virens Gv29-8]|uniref:Uncharacterized protein n=1 Tax=Hypocrea virens (strain Gv29-8 / FGSC 10586) TaxID=413071 RepID=G9N6J2_HYPVG|nr:uncharacterized protein TRIVIDRAFT_66654 [Trichoderma virens Gv29-8]EHK17752.1 hypothetical protein TRIVIDRAFT_66654 [Trichoderma virens Gv29-8]
MLNTAANSGLIRAEKPGTALPIPESRYPAVEKLLANAEDVTLTIRILASDKKSRRRRMTTLGCLKSFLPQIANNENIDISPSNTDLRAFSEAPLELGKEISSLYEALFTHCFCPESEEVIARIRLCNNIQCDDGKVTFGVLFKAHAHDESLPWWQDTHISVVQRTVRFEVSTNDENEIRVDSDLPFCSYISAQHEHGLILLEFLVTEQKLYFQESLDPLRYWGFDRPSISLGQLLEEVSLSAEDMTEKRKEVLSWLLAKATWQYYNSKWMLKPWNKESVHFLSEQRRTEDGHQLDGIFVNEPLLSISIAPQLFASEDTKACSQRRTDTKSSPKQRRLPFGGKPVHPIPKILALGIMLMEIQLCRPIETLHEDPEWSQYCPNGKPNQNTNFKICRDLIAKKSFFDDISGPLEGLIRACIQPLDVFVPPHVRDEEDIRGALYVLVNRLEVQLYGPIHKKLKGNVHDQDVLCRKWLSTSSTSTESWFKRIDSFNYLFKAKDDDEYNKVKIAVLDTGVDPTDAAAAYIAGYRDFVSGDDSIKCDNTGHGTTLVNLIFDMCDMASVHVARIFDTDEANDNTQTLAIKAIDWCITQNMDVICMACGFNEYNEELYKKIHEASGKMLIFAAPTNEANVGGIAYPAQFDSHVFCMFSTDGAVTNSRRLNPTSREGYTNFAILGEDIKTLRGEEKSGTSFSTAIATGLAGRLLEFSRHSDCQGRLKNASMMKVKDGMAKILKAMAVKDGHFNCLKPWMLLPKELQNQIPFNNDIFPTEAEKMAARDYIRNVMSQRLSDA